MRSITVRGAITAALAGLAATSCDSSTGNKEQKIAILVTSASFTVGQGSNADVLITIERTNFDKPVTLAVDGALPTGVTATFSQNPLASGTSLSTLTIVVAPNANPTTATFDLRASGDGVTDQTRTISLTVNVTGSYTLGMLEPSLRVAQGGGGTATVLVTRSGGNGGNVSLSVSGAPAGVGATLAQATTSDRAVSLTVSATAAVAPGTYPITITSSSPGFTMDQTTNFSIVVISPPSTTSVSVPFCVGSLPAWVAYQNEGYFWERVLPTGSNFVFSATDKVALAFVFASASESETNIMYISRAELTALSDRDCDGTRTYPGTVSGLNTGQSALVVMGVSGVLASATSGSFTLADVAARPLDLVATSGIVTQNAFLAPDRMIVRRGLDLPSGTTIPDLNFTAAESFAPASSNLTVSGTVGGDLLLFQNTLRTATNSYGTLQVAAPVGTTATLYAVPANQLAAGDLHEFFVDASNASVTVGHAYVEYFRDPADKTIALSPILSAPSVATLSATPYARMRASLPAQAEYPTVARFHFSQGPFGSRRFVIPVLSAAHLGAMPATWEFVIPDLSGTSGFNAAWMLSAGQNVPYLVEAFSGRGDLLFGALPVTGDVYRLAYRELSTTTTLRIRDAASPPRRLGLTPQYLRR